jgi:hypothetical protein
MKTIIFSLIISILGISSCSENCNDCEPTSSARYFIKNGSGVDLKLIFNTDSTVLKSDTLELSNNESIAFLYFTTGSPSQSALSFDYSLCYSIKILDNTGLRSMSNNLEDCNDLYNSICTSNYTLIKSEEVKKGKNKGSKYSEYEFVIK